MTTRKGFAPTEPSVRFWRLVRGGDVSECWNWTGVRDHGGYGQFRVTTNVVRAHRFAYMDLIGPIPDGLVIDHLCRNRACVNPWHLEPVTDAVNNRRRLEAADARTHCIRGHELTPDNLANRANGARSCKACNTYHRNRWRARIKAEMAAGAASAPSSGDDMPPSVA